MPISPDTMDVMETQSYGTSGRSRSASVYSASSAGSSRAGPSARYYNKMAKRKSFKMPSSTRLLAKQAWLNASFLRKITDVDKKSLVTTWATDTIDSTGFFQCLSQVGEGDDYNTRTGRKILAKSLEIKYQVVGSQTNPQTAIPLYSAIRFIVFIDTLQNGATPSLADMPTDPNFFRLNEPAKTSRYRILCDQTANVYTEYTTAADTFQQVNQRTLLVRKFFKLDLPIFYLGTAAAAASNGTNAIFIYWIGDSSTAAGGAPSVYGQTKLSWFDA